MQKSQAFLSLFGVPDQVGLSDGRMYAVFGSLRVVFSAAEGLECHPMKVHARLEDGVWVADSAVEVACAPRSKASVTGVGASPGTPSGPSESVPRPVAAETPVKAPAFASLSRAPRPTSPIQRQGSSPTGGDPSASHGVGPGLGKGIQVAPEADLDLAHERHLSKRSRLIRVLTPPAAPADKRPAFDPAATSAPDIAF